MQSKNKNKIYMQCSETCFILLRLPEKGPDEPVNERTRLEQLAIDAHHRGEDWQTFWLTVAGDVAALEPWDNMAYRRIVNRLSHLLTCGNTGGMRPVDTGWERPAEWELDDLASAST